MNEARNEMLVQPAWLAASLDDPTLRILDCTTHMVPQPVGASKIVSGRADYLAGHLPGAQHVDMVEDLSDPAGPYPYTLPSPERVEQLLSRLGISNEHRIIIYGRSSLVTLTRAWYVLHAMGHRRVALLDGGFQQWQRQGLPVTAELPTFAPTTYRAHHDPRRKASLEEVRRAATSEVKPAPGNRPADSLLLNALSPEQFAGTGGAHYGRPGRIPGSVNVPARDLSNPETLGFESLDRLRAMFEQAGALQARRVIHYCGGGIAATATAFALEMLGHPDWAVYDNSLLEWSTLPDTALHQG